MNKNGNGSYDGRGRADSDEEIGGAVWTRKSLM